MRLSLTMLLPALLLACSGSGISGRDAVLVEWLQRDNAVWLSRDPELLPGKYRRMLGDEDGDGIGEDPYDLMRGTAGLFHEDLQRLEDDLGYARGPEARSVLILGDPHPENLATFLPLDSSGPRDGEAAPELVVAWADLDAAAFGPWISDVRRGVQGLLIFTQDLQGCAGACQVQLVRAFAEGYDTGIRATATGRDTSALHDDLHDNRLARALIEEAAREGAERKRLRRLTWSHEGARLFETVATEEEAGRGYRMPVRAEKHTAQRVLAAWASAEQARTGRPVRVLDIVRRYGQGVSSWPATRFVVLWDTGTDGDDDDRLLNVREVLDPPAYPTPERPASPPWRSNAERVLYASRSLWPRPDLDPRLGGVNDGVTSWKIQSCTSFFQGLDHDKSAEVWEDAGQDPADLVRLARGIGAALALAHARGRTASGAPSLDVIRQDLGEDPDALSEALLQVAFQDLERTLDDHARFGRLLKELGPVLGAETSAASSIRTPSPGGADRAE